MKKNKIDIEAKLFIFILHLKEEKNQEYSIEDCETKLVYLFDNYDEFRSYFVTNGFSNISENLLEICTMKKTKKGTIIALKRLCDYAIRRHDYIENMTQQQKFDVLAVPCNVGFVVARDKVEKFKNVKSDPEVLREMQEMAEKFKINNLLDEGPVKIKKK